MDTPNTTPDSDTKVVGKMLINPNHRVHNAILRTPVEYLIKCLEMRAGKNSIGSSYPGLDFNELEEAISDATWEPYTHVAVSDPCVAFITRSPALRGRLGIVQLKDLPSATQIILVDPKTTGFLEGVVVPGAATVLGPEVDFTVMILGPNAEAEVVYTFHPGDPIAPSRITIDQVDPAYLAANAHDSQRSPNSAVAYITAKEALKMGLEWVKIAQKETP